MGRRIEPDLSLIHIWVQGNAGYIGHTVLNAEGPMCVCGNRGCLDAYAGELLSLIHICTGMDGRRSGADSGIFLYAKKAAFGQIEPG